MTDQSFLLNTYQSQRLNIYLGIGLTLSSIVYLLLVYPALYGSFEFDDLGNLSQLSKVNDLKSGIYYAFERINANLGRPVSLLTFAAQSDSWPSDPFSFKLVNLIIHYMNGILVFVILSKLFRTKFDRKTAYILSFTIYTFWLFAPIHIFTVFYVVQRMTLLSAFFVLTGCLFYIYIRPKINKDTTYKTLSLLTISYLISLVFGILSKENAILLPVFILIIEYSFFSPSPSPHKHWKAWCLIFLWLPIALLFIYLLIKGKLYYNSSHLYPFSSSERILNEAIILWHYIKQIIIPEYGSYGLVHDDYKIVHSFVDNSKTIFSVSAICIIIFIAVYFRRLYPLIFFGVFWFFGGHLLESTAIKLELIFDHRNYLPSLGIIIIVTTLVFSGIQHLKSRFIRNVFFITLLAYSALYLLVLNQTAHAWSSSYELSKYQVQFHPDSKRAQAHLISYLFNTGQYKAASRILDHLENQYPDDIVIQLNKLLFSNLNDNFSTPKREKYLTIAKNGPFERTIANVLLVMFDCIIDKNCKKITHKDYRELISALQQNPKLRNANSAQLMAVQKSKSFSQEERWNDAINSLLNVSEDKRTRIEFYFLLTQYQFMAKRYDEAMQTINTIQQKIKYSPVKQLALKETINKFILHIKMKQQSNNSTLKK